MTPFPYSVDADDPVEKVEKLMQQHHIRHIPVQKNGRVVGIVAARDMQHRTDRSAPTSKKTPVSAREVMTFDPYSVSFNTPLDEVVSEMRKRHIGSAIVVRNGKLAGILSVMDVCSILAEILRSEFSSKSGGDAA
jgi:acetoin utilization protein AcuB